MDAQFWHERWQTNRIAFHENKGNSALKRYFEQLGLAAGACIFVPLCGKSCDIDWLLAQRYRVVGVELSELAVEAVFERLEMTPECIELNGYRRYSCGSLTIYCADVFSLQRAELGVIDAVYDRAALVALPETMRVRYAAHVIALSAQAPQLLLSFEYDQAQLEGPPFSLSSSDIEAYYAQCYRLEILAQGAIEGGLKGKVDALETLWHLRPNE
ncbi:MAG: thiopurine S-methyltransferase [Pseudomonadales bacterium]